MTWLTGYTYRKKITITGQTGAGTNYQVKLQIGNASGGNFNLNNHSQNFPNDIRFTNSTSYTQLDYWIEDVAASPITVWVNVADSLNSNIDIYCYYGKASDTTTSNGINTFILFDDFADGNYTTNPVWTPISGSWSVSGNYLTTTTSSINTDIDIGTLSTTSTNAEWQWQWRCPGTTVDNWNYIGSVKFNYIDANNYYLLLADIRPNSYTTRMYFQKYVAGSYTSIGTSVLGTSWGSDTSWHTFKITRDSLNEFKIYLDNTLKITATDSSHTTSSKLVANFNIGGSGPRTSNFDNFRIRKYASPEPTLSNIGSEELLPGSLQITSYPSGAGIYLALHNQTPASTGIYTPDPVTNLSPGSYDLRLTRNGYADWTFANAQIISNTETQISATMATLANITATGMTKTPSESPCRTVICTILVSVTWTNNGGSSGSFVPSITVSSGTVTPTYSSEQLTAGSQVTHTFTVSDMTVGSCSICPNPN